jgi:hypothetical protein
MSCQDALSVAGEVGRILLMAVGGATLLVGAMNRLMRRP